MVYLDKLLEMLAHLEGYGGSLPGTGDWDTASFVADLSHVQELTEQVLEERNKVRGELQAFLEGRENGPIVHLERDNMMAVVNASHLAAARYVRQTASIVLSFSGGEQAFLDYGMEGRDVDVIREDFRKIQGAVRRAHGLEGVLEEMGAVPEGQAAQAVDAMREAPQFLLTAPRSAVEDVEAILEELERRGVTVERLDGGPRG